jgi:hypothetical protein
VLAVTPYRGTADALLSRLDAAGLGDLVLPLHDGTGDRLRLLAALGTDLERAVAEVPPGAAEEASFSAEAAAASARDAAAELTATVAALHAVRQPWGVSAYEAMVALAGLMASPSPPRTRVRLPNAVCRRLDAKAREELRADLREAAALGAFTLTPDHAPWLEARVTSEDDARRALEAARAGRESLAVATESMRTIAASAGTT